MPMLGNMRNREKMQNMFSFLFIFVLNKEIVSSFIHQTLPPEDLVAVTSGTS